MATKLATAPDTTEKPEDPIDSPLLDTLGAGLKKLLQKGKERGYVTVDELSAALPAEEVTSEQIEDTMAMISEMGINLVDSEETEDVAEEKPATTDGKVAVAASEVEEEEDYGRTDDPVRMYLREMGSVELLSREGEIAIAKRIEAGQEKMIGAICESPLTITALLEWRDALNDNRMLLRDVIDLEATYGGGPDAAASRPTRRTAPTAPCRRARAPPCRRSSVRLRCPSRRRSRLRPRLTARPPKPPRRARRSRARKRPTSRCRRWRRSSSRKC